MPSVLKQAGFAAESLILESNFNLALDLVFRRRVITCASHDYPLRLLERLGPLAPAAFWWNGVAMPSTSAITVVGSRDIDESTWRWCQELAREAKQLGYAIVSGGAPGCDSAAIGSAGKEAGIEIWPCGIDTQWTSFRGPILSVSPPDDPFSCANAMERNALLYAFSSHSVVCAARLREGGTWHGAVSAIRRRLSRMVIRDDSSPAAAALAALGAVPLSKPAELASALACPDAQGQFDIATARYEFGIPRPNKDICEVAAQYAV